VCPDPHRDWDHS
jgi:hypothetical protein